MTPSFSAMELDTPNSVYSSYYTRTDDLWIRSSVTVGRSALSDETLRILAKLQSFHRLNGNWDSYNAAKPSPKAIKSAASFVCTLDQAGFRVYFTGPGPDGEILVEVRDEDCSVEVSFNDDCSVEYVAFQGTLPSGEGDYEPSVSQLSAMLRTGI